MPHILLLDTSGAGSITGIASDGVLRCSAFHSDTRSQAAAINGLIGKLCDECGLPLSAIHAVAVCSGPGSYTGLRISMSTAKGIAFALGIPLILHDKLSLLAWQQQQRYPETAQFGTIITAREGEYFFAGYDRKGLALHPPRHLLLADMQAFISQHPELLYSGDAAAIGSLGSGIQLAETVDPSAWALLAEQRYQEQAFADLAAAQPFYMKEVFIHQRKAK